MNNFQGLKCVGYYRTSSKSQESVIWQETTVRKFAKEQGMSIDKEFVEHISGAKLAHERPIFSEACRYCNANGYVMVVASIDRLTRNTMFPIDFPKELRGDFDIIVIEPKVSKGYATIEEIGLSVLEFNERYSVAMDIGK